MPKRSSRTAEERKRAKREKDRKGRRKKVAEMREKGLVSVTIWVPADLADVVRALGRKLESGSAKWLEFLRQESFLALAAEYRRRPTVQAHRRGRRGDAEAEPEPPVAEATPAAEAAAQGDRIAAGAAAALPPQPHAPEMEARARQHLEEGRARLDAGRFADAEMEFHQAALLSPRLRLEAVAGWIEAAFFQQQYETVLQFTGGLWNGTRLTDAEAVGILYWEGCAAEEAGRYDRAIDRFERVRAVDPADARVEEAMARVLARAGRR